MFLRKWSLFASTVTNSEKEITGQGRREKCKCEKKEDAWVDRTQEGKGKRENGGGEREDPWKD